MEAQGLAVGPQRADVPQAPRVMIHRAARESGRARDRTNVLPRNGPDPPRDETRGRAREARSDAGLFLITGKEVQTTIADADRRYQPFREQLSQVMRGAVPREADLSCEPSDVNARMLGENAKDASAGGCCVSRHADAQAPSREIGGEAVRAAWTEPSRSNEGARYARRGECV